ncbi:MAG: hypothetical protein DWQ31_05675 [Planctomycetota bacterium]|nr:MAG: hypothetical protein DWQ31_05675 [Planctomycetota bacterium]
MTERVIKWSAEVARIFGDVSSDDRIAAWNGVKRSCPVGSIVSGAVMLKAPFGLWLDVGVGFPALLLITRLEHPTTSREYEDFGSQVGNEIRATVYRHDDKKRTLVLTEKPLNETL